MCERVVQRVGTGADGRAVLTVGGETQETVSGLRTRRSEWERTHPLPTFGFDQFPHLQSDPVAPSAGERAEREQNYKNKG